MRGDGELPHTGAIGQLDGHPWQGVVLASLLLEPQSERRQTDGVALECVGQRGVGGAGPVVVQQSRELGRGLRERDLVFQHPLEEGLGVGKLAEQPIASLRCTGGALEGDERFDVTRIFDRATSVVAARMAGHLVRSLEDAYRVVARDQGQWLADELGWDRVVVAIKTQVRGLAAGLGQHEVALEGVFGQRQEPGSFFIERPGDGLLGIAGAGPGMGPVGSPTQELGVQILDIAEVAGGEEAVAQEADLPLDAPLLVTPGHGARARHEVVVTGQFEKPWMKLDGLISFTGDVVTYNLQEVIPVVDATPVGARNKQCDLFDG